MTNIDYLNSCFYKGKYKYTIDNLGRKLTSTKSQDFELLTCLQIGALIFLGEFLEARSLFELSLKKITPSALFLSRCRFYLGIGSVRRSAYVEAAQLFAQNIFEFRKNKSTSPEITFYLFQGAAFLRFFKGQYAQSARLAQKAYTSALQTEIMYPQILSLDLLGHSLCQTGSVRQGLHELEKAILLAQQLGNGGILVALQISKIKYHAQFGLDIKNTIQNLQNAIASLQPQDTYSKAELHLELSRQLVLRGRGKDAQIQLENASALIYSHQNKRQSALFNLRFAHLLFLKGETLAALVLTQSQRQNLNKNVDRAILCPEYE